MAAVPAALSWRDPKRYLWPLALLTPLLPLEATTVATNAAAPSTRGTRARAQAPRVPRADR